MVEDTGSNRAGAQDAPALRRARWDDLEAATRLIYKVCAQDGDTSVAVTSEELANEWRNGDFDVEQDVFLVEASDGGLIGYAEVYNVRGHCDLRGDMYVLHEYKESGASDLLIRAMESRAGEHVQMAEPHLQVVMRVTVDNRDDSTKGKLEDAGFTPIRYHWRMGIELEDEPAIPPLPSGLEARPFVREQHAEAVLQARNEAFLEHWGSHTLTMEQFTHYHFDNPEYDPSLWVVIWDGKELAGFSINRYRMGIGWVQTLGVRPAWRRHGLGLALLSRSFSKFYQRGVRELGLGVDASNTTGATRLYQKAGMRVVSEFASFGKELRAGRPLDEDAEDAS